MKNSNVVLIITNHYEKIVRIFRSFYPNGHPSARHSEVNWADPNLDKFPEFAHATANEVILRPGQVLYLPTNWFHFIVSLDLNFQCNTRSGQTDTYPLDSCGFPYTK